MNISRLAFLLFVLFISVYVISAACSIRNVVQEVSMIPNIQLEENSSHGHSPSHAHQHGVTKSVHHTNGDNETGDSDSKDDKCCDEITFNFFNTAKIINEHVRSKIELISGSLVCFFEFNNYINQVHIPGNNHLIFLRQKIPDIRVFLQSFIL